MVALYDGSDALAPQEVITGKGVIDSIQDDGDTALAVGSTVALKIWLGVPCQARKRTVAISGDRN